MFEPDGSIRPCYAEVQNWVERTGIAGLNRRMDEAEAIFRRIGITFAVYGEGGDPERLIPFDLLPRIFTGQEWRVLDRSEEHTSELQSLLRISYAVFCLKKTNSPTT